MAKKTHEIRAKLKASTGKFVSMRTMAISTKKVTRALAHNLRATKTGCLTADPTQHNLIHIDGRIEAYGHLEGGLQNLKNTLMRRVPALVQQHKKSWNDNPDHKRGNNWNKTKHSFAESIIWFGGKDQGTELQADSLVNKLIEQYGKPTACKKLLIKARLQYETMAEEFNLELIGPTVMHLDEDGQPHFHQLHTNFDPDTGHSPNFSKNRTNGRKLQDMVYDIFKKLGFKRGIPVEDREQIGEQNRYQTPHQYSAKQDQLNMVAKSIKKDTLALKRKRAKKLKLVAEIDAEFSDPSIMAQLSATGKLAYRTMQRDEALASITGFNTELAENATELERLQTIIDAHPDDIRKMALDAKKSVEKADTEGYERGVHEARKSIREHEVAPLKTTIYDMQQTNEEISNHIQQMLNYFGQFSAMTGLVNHITKHHGKDQYLIDNLPSVGDINNDLEEDLLTKMTNLSTKLKLPFKAD